MFHLHSESRFAYSGWAEHQYERTRRRAVDGIHQFIACCHQARMRHGEITEVIQALD
jgi:hypothetical protein